MKTRLILGNRGTNDPSHCGNYIFGDYQDTRYFKGTEDPVGSGRFVRTEMSVKCSNISQNCDNPSRILSFGEDYDGEVYILAENVKKFL